MLNLFQHDMVFGEVAPVDWQPCVHMLASQKRGTLYIGVTSNLARRLYQHRGDKLPGFTRDYSVHRLVWAENHDAMASAIAREKQLRRWHRQWKINLIEAANPEWRDLAVEWNLAPALGEQG
jgi:putative endonuclease